MKLALDKSEIRDRLENLTQGDWEFFSIDPDDAELPIGTIRVRGTNRGVVGPHPGSYGQIRGRREDLQFIADAPQIIRELLDKLEEND
jgi:hypothetical protein